MEKWEKWSMHYNIGYHGSVKDLRECLEQIWEMPLRVLLWIKIQYFFNIISQYTISLVGLNEFGARTEMHFALSLSRRRAATSSSASSWRWLCSSRSTRPTCSTRSSPSASSGQTSRGSPSTPRPYPRPLSPRWKPKKVRDFEICWYGNFEICR